MGAEKFRSINRGFNSVFKADQLSLGLVVPIERYDNTSVPSMQAQIERIQLAEKLGFSAVWLRDIPYHVPSFGDAGQVFDPFVYLGALALQTNKIALGIASVVLPLRHPAHVAKAAFSADVLSGGRVLMGVASGDRPDEYPALNLSFHDRGDRFRESFEYIRQVSESYPIFENSHGVTNGQMDLLPKPSMGDLPMLVTGGSRQSMAWTAEHADGWMTYPRPLDAQEAVISVWQKALSGLQQQPKPVMQSLYIDLLADKNAPAKPIHLGYQLGVKALVVHLKLLESIGVNHVALNLRFNQADVEQTLLALSESVLNEFKGGIE